MSLSRRNLITLIASILLSTALLILERATESKVLLTLQFPGFFACIRIWAIHSWPENPAKWMIVFGAVNALVYWPIIFALSFLLVRRPRPANFVH